MNQSKTLSMNIEVNGNKAADVLNFKIPEHQISTQLSFKLFSQVSLTFMNVLRMKS